MKRGGGEENTGYEASEGEQDVGSAIGRREEGYGSIQVRQIQILIQILIEMQMQIQMRLYTIRCVYCRTPFSG